jgi:hypothetical protein
VLDADCERLQELVRAIQVNQASSKQDRVKQDDMVTE